MRFLPFALAGLALVGGCASDPSSDSADAQNALDVAHHHSHPAPTPTRDWSTYPAIATATAPGIIYAVSDIHGGRDRAVNLFTQNGLIGSSQQWTGGNAVLVVAGDNIDKGPQSVEVIELLMALQTDAAAKGGQVIVTLGNHEAEFFVDPNNSKATGPGGIDGELSQDSVAPADLADGADPRGAWLRNRPFGVIIGDWFFSHAGDTGGLSPSALESQYENAVNAHPDFNDPSIVGTTSILESRDWYTQGSTVKHNLAALGVNHIVFGHDPNALGPKGAIAVDPKHQLIRIDCGLSPLVNDSTGMLLRIQRSGSTETADELDASGAVRSLF
jgi:hypothetical protein